jgi:hypothetical protein
MAKGFSFAIAVKVHKGRIDVDRKALDAELATWPTCEATLTIETAEAKRSSAANRYLWGPVYDEIHDYTGQDKEDIHDEMCTRFTTETISYVNPATGEMIEIEVVRRTSGMKAKRFHKFLEDVKLFWQEFGGLTFAEPGDDVRQEYERAVAREAKKGAAA